MRITILGCGSSTGVPKVGNDWGACNPANPKNRRTRQSLLVERDGPNGTTRLLVDTPPDLRDQLLAAGIGKLDAVVFTHEHADHVHGIHELQAVAENQGFPLKAFLARNSWEIIRPRFPACFVSTAPPRGQGFLDDCLVDERDGFRVTGDGGEIHVQVFFQDHWDTQTLGLRFARLAYSVDFSHIAPRALEQLEGLDVWILDCLRHAPHPSHTNVEQALALVKKIKPQLAVLSGLSSELDFDALGTMLPQGIVPAYDGMVLLTAEAH